MVRLGEIIEQDVVKALNNLNDLRPEEQAARRGLGMIRRRTDQGIDRHGISFPPYARSTIARKRQRGQQITPVNLRDSGRMMGRMTVRQRRGSARQGIRGGRTVSEARIMFGSRRDERIARFHMDNTRVRTKIPYRDIMGFTEQEKTILNSEFTAGVQRILFRDRRRRFEVRVFV